MQCLPCFCKPTQTADIGICTPSKPAHISDYESHDIKKASRSSIFVKMPGSARPEVAEIIEENTACKGEDKDVKGMSPLRNGGRMEKA
jgi:hypothetical protein